jgi:hypothetical protein
VLPPAAPVHFGKSSRFFSNPPGQKGRAIWQDRSRVKKAVQLQHGIRVRVGGSPAECAPTAAFACVDAIGCAVAVAGLALGAMMQPASVASGSARVAFGLLYSRRRQVFARPMISSAIVQWALTDAERAIVQAFRSPGTGRRPVGGSADPVANNLDLGRLREIRYFPYGKNGDATSIMRRPFSFSGSACGESVRSSLASVLDDSSPPTPPQPLRRSQASHALAS